MLSERRQDVVVRSPQTCVALLDTDFAVEGESDRPRWSLGQYILPTHPIQAGLAGPAETVAVPAAGAGDRAPVTG